MTKKKTNKSEVESDFEGHMEIPDSEYRYDSEVEFEAPEVSEVEEIPEINEDDLRTVITAMSKVEKPEAEKIPQEIEDAEKPSVVVNAMQTSKKLGLITREKAFGSRKYFPNRTRY